MSARDTADPEIVDAGETPRGAFIEVAVSREGETGRFRFRCSSAERTLVDRILTTRPFKTTTALPYHYYYGGHGGRGAPVIHLLYVRIEQGGEQRTIEFDASEALVSNLQWFRQIPSLAFAAHLSAPA
jgi:hypothetical protein